MWRAMLCSVLLAASLLGVTIQDTSVSTYVTGDDNYTGVVEINFDIAGQSYLCSGALISSEYVLTAGHCVSGADDWTVTFQTPSESGEVISVANAYLDPAFTPYPSNSDLAGLDEYDVAVLQLSQPAPADATIYSVDTSFTCSSIINSLVDIVGYGLGGNPTAGILPYGIRRAAEQSIQGCAASVNGVTTPDNPLIMEMSFPSSPNANTAGYGLINSGDSGGPALLGDEIVGIADFGDLPQTGDYESDYEYLTGEENLSNIQIASFVDQFVAPESSTSVLAIGGFAVLMLLRRRYARGRNRVPGRGCRIQEPGLRLRPRPPMAGY